MSNKLYFDADNLPPRVETPGGDGTNPHYRLDPLTDTVIRDGDDDLQAMIDAAESSVNIYDVIKRYQQSGNPSLLQQRQAMFGDYRIADGSYQNLLMLGREIRNAYEALTPEDRAKVGTFNDFIRTMSAEASAPAAAAAEVSDQNKNKEETNNE